MCRKPVLIALSFVLVRAGLTVAQAGAAAPVSLPTPASPPPAACAAAELMPPCPLPGDGDPGCCVPVCEPSCTRPGNQLSVRGEYLFWNLKAAPTPPLLTTSGPADFATLGGGTTVTQFGGRDTQYGPLSGGRLIVDYQLNDIWGMQVNGFLLEQRTRATTVRSDGSGNPTIGVPFVSAFDGSEQANLLSSPGALAGGATASARARLWGVEANATGVLTDNNGWRLQGLAGFRHANLSERLQLNTTSTLLATPGLFAGTVVPTGTTFTSSDDFGTQNNFYGGQIGAQGEWRRGIFFVTAYTKVALGVAHERSTISGGTTAFQPDGTVSSVVGGTLAQASNAGQTTQNKFAVLPEVGVNAGVQLSQHLSVSAGYSFLYWSNVVRPGDQVDRVVNANLIPTLNDGTRLGPNAPLSSTHSTDFWAHGLTFAAQLTW